MERNGLHPVTWSIKPHRVNSGKLTLTPIRKLPEICVLPNLSDTAPKREHDEHGSPMGYRRTWLTLSPPGHPVLPSSPLLQPSKIVPKVCPGKMRRGEARRESGETGGMKGDRPNHLRFCTKPHYINYPHQNQAGQICPYLQVIFRVSFAVIVRTSFWMLRVG